MKSNMKVILIGISILFTCSCFAQLPITNDTIICIVDTSNHFTTHRLNPVKRDTCPHWAISIQGSYYDHLSRYNADFACIVLKTSFMGNSWVKDPLSFETNIDSIEERFIVVTDEWLYNQKNLQTIMKKIGFAPWAKYNYIIFIDDIENSKNGNVTVYRVLAGYNEFQE